MGERLVFTSNVAEMVRQNGGFEPDNEGYYTIRAGTFGVPNSAGIVYELSEELIKTLERSSPFMMRVTAGKLFSENGHPERLPGMTDKEYFTRLARIVPDRVCGFIKDVIVEFNKNKTEAVVYLKVKPFGELKHVMEDAFKDDNINASFSVRTICRQSGYVRTVIVLVTWDFVTINGVNKSDKVSSVGLTVGNEELLSIDLANQEEVGEFKKTLSDLRAIHDKEVTEGLESSVNMDFVDTVEKFFSECQGENCIYRW